MKLDADAFAKWVLDVVGPGPWPEFKRGGFYNEHGFQIEYYHEKDGYYGRWIDHFLSIHLTHREGPRSTLEDRLIGCTVAFNRGKPAFPEAIHGDKLFLDEYIAVKMKKDNDPEILAIYQKVVEMVKGVKIDLHTP